jgi:hypothetical protein
MTCTGGFDDIWRSVQLDRGRAGEFNAEESRVNSYGDPVSDFGYQDEDGVLRLAQVIPYDDYTCEACGQIFLSWHDVQDHWRDVERIALVAPEDG